MTRHYYVSRLLAAGVDLVRVAEAAGDKEATILAHYGHLIPDAGDRVRAAIDAGVADCAPDVRTGEAVRR